jgi:tetratricopeptide (TPR) repeat protein
MNLDRCYDLLGLDRDASLDDLKTAYRQLARKLHPDLNQQDTDAHQRFINLNQAYEILLEKTPVKSPSVAVQSSTVRSSQVRETVTQPDRFAAKTEVKIAPDELNPVKAQLKWQSYEQLKIFLKQRQFSKAIAIVDGLAERIPNDIHIRQWQGIVYCQFGRELIDRQQIIRARAYLKKALKIDPHNRDLWQQVNAEFSRIEGMM